MKFVRKLSRWARGQRATGSSVARPRDHEGASPARPDFSEVPEAAGGDASPTGPRPGPDRRVEETEESSPDRIWSQLARSLDDLEASFDAPSSDVPTMLADLRGFEPGMIRQPATAAQKVLRLLKRRHYSSGELASVIESDPALAQALLRHANSAWYSSRNGVAVTSLVAAERRIGATGVHAAVMSTLMEGGIARPGAGLNDLAKTVWDHMVRVAPMARHFAHGLGADPDAAFTLGLCHDVGKLVLLDRIADLRRRLQRDIRFPDGFLRAALMRLHEPLGGITALTWGLPEDFAGLIASHHRSPPPPAADLLSEAIFVVERLDIAMRSAQAVDVERLWERGTLTTSVDVGKSLVEETVQAAAAAAIG